MGRTLILGGTGMLGRAIGRQLRKNVSIHDDVAYLFSSEYDLTDSNTVKKISEFIVSTEIDTIYMCAGIVGGIGYNKENQIHMMMQNHAMGYNAIQMAYELRIPNFVYVSSSCVYPINKKMPLKESDLFTGEFEPTNAGYATAKAACMQMVNVIRNETDLNWKNAIPCNLYGPGMDFSGKSHVIAMLVRKIYEAKMNNHSYVTVWGDGTPKREFLHVDDAAAAIILAKEIYTIENVNIGYGSDISISDLAKKISSIVGWDGEIRYDVSKPNGIDRKLMHSSMERYLNWKPKIDLDTGIKELIKGYELQSDQSIRFPPKTGNAEI